MHATKPETAGICQLFCAASGALVATVNVGRNLQQIEHQVWNVADHRMADVGDAKIDRPFALDIHREAARLLFCR